MQMRSVPGVTRKFRVSPQLPLHNACVIIIAGTVIPVLNFTITESDSINILYFHYVLYIYIDENYSTI